MENLQGGTLALEHRYHIDQRLRSAGLVTVYAGTQDPFDLPVRIAVFDGLPEAGAQDSVVHRIKQSARRSSSLSGDGLLRAVDFGEIDRGIPFVIEETIPGDSLAHSLDRKGVFSPGDVADLVARLADLLDVAHAQEQFHGNIKARWVILPDGKNSFANAHLGHFGLGLSMTELRQMAQPVMTTDLVDAFPPEAFEDDPNSTPHLSAAADQWALAALAYRLLVGVHPYFDDPVDASAGLLQIKSEPAPTLSEMGIDVEIARVVDRALHREPDERWPSIAAFASAFVTAVRGDEDFSDDRGLLPPERTIEDPFDDPYEDDPDPTSTPELTGPRPSGHLLTIALIALALSNLGWFFFSMSYDDTATEDAPADASTLPAGLQIQTTPPGASIFVVDPENSADNDTPLGSTPFVLSSSLRDQSSLQLLLRLPGFHDQHLFIEETAAGQDIRLALQPESGSDEGI